MNRIYVTHIGLILLGSIGAAAAAQVGVDWQAIERIPASQRIRVTTDKLTTCYFERVDEDSLTCFRARNGLWDDRARGPSRVVFRRAEVRAVQLDRDDDSAGYRSFIAAAGAGGGWGANGSPTAFAGVKIGGPITLNLGYDRLQERSGFTTEGAAVVPLFRLPRFQRYVFSGVRENPNRRFVQLYAEPGVGYRAGGGKYGGYSSAGMLFLLFPDDRTQPYVEVQRRFPFGGPLDGDTRIALGVMMTLCAHCGLN